MASDPSGLIAQLLSPQGINGFQQGQQQYQDQQTQQAGNQQALQIGALKIQGAIQAQQQAQQQQVAKQAASAAYNADPSPANLNKLIQVAPDEAEALTKGYQAMDAPRQQNLKTMFGQIYSAADSESPDALSSAITPIIAAEKAQGIDTTDAQTMLDNLSSSDPAKVAAAVKGAKAFSQIHLSALDPKFAEQMGIGKDATSDYAIEGGYKINKKTGETTYVGPADAKDNYIEVKNADGTTTQKYIGGQQRGGGPASTGVPAGRTTGGWTPRQANGGDNPDAVVDHKIAGAASFLGVPPTADISGMSPMKIAQAMTLSEGGAGSLADRNNNPANLRNGDGSYKVFPSKQAGLAAAAALVARKLKKGQTTVQSMIEGLPTGGVSSVAPASGNSRDITGSSAGGPGSSPIPDGLTGDDAMNYLKTKNPGIAARVQAVLDTRAAIPPTSTRNPINNAIAAAVNQIDPTFDQAAWKRRSDTIKQYTPGGDVGKYLLSGKAVIDHAYALAQSAQNLPDHYTAFQNRVSNAMTATGSAQGQNLIAYSEGLSNYGTELPKFLGGKAPAEGEIKQTQDSHAASLGKSGATKAILTDIDYIRGKFDPLIEAYKQQTGKDFDIDHQLPGGVVTPKLAALDYYKSKGVLPTVVTSPIQAAKLPSGSVFVTPDGQVRTKH